MRMHLLSAQRRGSLISTRWISENTIYEFTIEGRLDENTITFQLGDIEEVLYVPPYGSSEAWISLDEAKTVEDRTKRGDRLIKVMSGTITMDDIFVKRKMRAVPNIRHKAHKAKAVAEATT